MGARKIIKKRSTSQFEPYLRLAVQYAPLWTPIALVLLFTFLVAWPLSQKLSTLKQEIASNTSLVTTVEGSMAALKKMQEELVAFRQKVKEFEERLPTRLKTTLIIETLQEITKKSKLKFSSLEPLPVKRHVLEESGDVFVELPIQVKLQCGYYDLVDFLKKIEQANQLMKISNLSIKDNPSRDWEHDIEFSISAFSRGDSDE